MREMKDTRRPISSEEESRWHSQVGVALAGLALLLLAVGLFALGAAMGWVPIGVSERPAWIRAGVAVMGLILLGGGFASGLMMLFVRANPLELTDEGLRLPAWRFVLGRERGGEFIDRRDIAALEFHDKGIEVKVVLRTKSGPTKVFGCRKDMLDRLMSMRPPSK